MAAREFSRQFVAGVVAVWGLAALVWLLGAIGTDAWTRAIVVGLYALAASGLVLVLARRSEREWRERLGRIAVRLWASGDGQPGAAGGAETTVEAVVERLSDAGPLVAQRVARLDVRGGNLQQVVDALDEPVIATDEGRLVTLANRAAGEFFARPATALVGKPIEELFTQASVLELHAGAAAGRAGSAQARIARTGTGGTRVYQVAAAPCDLRSVGREGVSRGVVVTLRDVTELATAVQLKTDFVANASHELRTPLAAIKAAVETMGDSARDDPAMIERLTRMISSNVERLEALTRDLLDLSRLETPEAPVERQDFELAPVLEAVRTMFARACRERKVELVFEFPAQMARWHTDPTRLELIFKNLVENSVKFAYEGTAVRVVGEVLPDRGGRSADGAWEEGLLGARIRVIDSGVGIPLQSQARIFERFYQVDLSRATVGTPAPVKRGTGLGLAIVKHAVKALGGTISVESVWKQGTTMTVELPACVPADVRDGQSREHAPRVRGGVGRE